MGFSEIRAGPMWGGRADTPRPQGSQGSETVLYILTKPTAKGFTMHETPKAAPWCGNKGRWKVRVYGLFLGKACGEGMWAFLHTRERSLVAILSRKGSLSSKDLFIYLFCGEFSSFIEKHFWNKNSLSQMPCFFRKILPGKKKKTVDKKSPQLATAWKAA